MSGRSLGVSESVPALDGFKLSIDTPIVAAPGGTQAKAIAITPGFGLHIISTVASGNDSVKMERLATGSQYVTFVYNQAASNSAQLYGQGTDTIDGVATATGVAIAAGRGRILIDVAAGQWISFYGA